MTMEKPKFSEEARQFQDRFDTRRLADRVMDTVFRDVLNDTDCEFVSQAMFFFLATVDKDGQPQCSYKGGPRGFVQIADDRTLVIPIYEGNGLYLSAGNMAETGKVGLLFIDFEAQKRLRINGISRVVEDHPALNGQRAAQLAVEIKITDIHPNCPRNVHKMTLVEQSKYTPKNATEDVVKAPWGDSFADVLPEDMKPDNMKS